MVYRRQKSGLWNLKETSYISLWRGVIDFYTAWKWVVLSNGYDAARA
jgi:hypothetical protein